MLRLELDQYNIKSSSQRLLIYESMTNYMNGIKKELLDGRFKTEIPLMFNEIVNEYKRDLLNLTRLEKNETNNNNNNNKGDDDKISLYCTLRIGLESIRLWRQLNYNNQYFYADLSDQIDELEKHLLHLCSVLPSPLFNKKYETNDYSNSTVVLYFDHICHETPSDHVENQRRVATCLELIRKQSDEYYDDEKFKELVLNNSKDVLSPPLWALPLVHSPEYLSLLWTLTLEAKEDNDKLIPLEFDYEWESGDEYVDELTDDDLPKGRQGRPNQFAKLIKNFELFDDLTDIVASDKLDYFSKILTPQDGDDLVGQIFSNRDLKKEKEKEQKKERREMEEANKRSNEQKLHEKRLNEVSNSISINETSDTSRSIDNDKNFTRGPVINVSTPFGIGTYVDRRPEDGIVIVKLEWGAIGYFNSKSVQIISHNNSNNVRTTKSEKPIVISRKKIASLLKEEANKSENFESLYDETKDLSRYQYCNPFLVALMKRLISYIGTQNKTAEVLKLNHSNVSKYTSGVLSEKVTRKVDNALIAFFREYDIDSILDTALQVPIVPRLSNKRSREDSDDAGKVYDEIPMSLNEEKNIGTSVTIKSNNDNDISEIPNKKLKIPVTATEEDHIQSSDKMNVSSEVEEVYDEEVQMQGDIEHNNKEVQMQGEIEHNNNSINSLENREEDNDNFVCSGDDEGESKKIKVAVEENENHDKILTDSKADRLPLTRADKFPFNQHYARCEECKMDIRNDAFHLCATCPLAYHIGCETKIESIIFNENWYCENCYNMGIHKSRFLTSEEKKNESLLKGRFLSIFSVSLRRWRLCYCCSIEAVTGLLHVKWIRFDLKVGRMGAVDISKGDIALIEDDVLAETRYEVIMRQSKGGGENSAEKKPKKVKKSKEDKVKEDKVKEEKFKEDKVKEDIVKEDIVKEELIEVVDKEDKKVSSLVSDTLVTKNSLKAALCAAGSACKAVDIVLCNSNTNAFVCTRPPGHHAGRFGCTSGCLSTGFCILNNAAIALVYSRVRWGLERVAVVDIDVHFGNGTADILKNDPKAFFASIHMIYGDMNNGCYDLPDDPPHAKRAGFYPPLLGTAETTNNYISVGILPSDVHASVAKERYRGNTGFRKALTEVVIPKLELFNPQLLIISAGFDGYKYDPLGCELNLSKQDYEWVTQQLTSVMERVNGVGNGKIVSLLEGGYDTDPETLGLATCVNAHVKSLRKL